MDRFQREYVTDNWEKFIRDSKRWSKDIEKLKADLEEITFLRGATDNVGRGSDISRPVESLASKREEILAEMGEIDFFKEMFDTGWKSLSEDEKKLLRGMIFTDSKRIDAFVDIYGMEHGDISRQWVYKLKNKALGKFANAIKQEYSWYFVEIGRL